ncbi:MAG: DNA polymerase I [Acidimicrobiales bacterium]
MNDQSRAAAPGALFLLDAMSLAFRAYFALPVDLTTSSGTVTNALYGFVSMLVNVVRDHRPSALAVAFDLPGGTFRHEMVEAYKGGRAETPDDLLPQFDMIRTVLAALNVPSVGVPGYEADDVLATLATEARDRGHDVVVVTGDRDCFQLVEDPHVRVLYNRRGVSEYALYDEAGIVERTALPPSQYPLLASLRGDPSDNLPGVPGIGDKTAARLLAEYGDLDNLFANLDRLTPRLRENLAGHEALVRANASVIPLVRDVPLVVDPDDLTLGGWDLATVKTTYERFELRTLWRRTTDLLAGGLLGVPAPGSAVPETEGAEPGAADGVPSVTDLSPAGAEPAGGDLPLAPPPAEPLVAERPATPAEALVALAVLDEITGTGGDGACEDGTDGTVRLLSVAGRWEGTPGRSPLEGLALVAAGPPGRAVWLEPSVLGDGSVAGVLTGLLGRAPIVGHGVKELLRSLSPFGIDGTGVVMDTEVAAYLLDPSTGDYGLAAVTRPAASAAGVDGEGVVGATAGTAPPASGQLSLGGSLDAGTDDGAGESSSEDAGQGRTAGALVAAAVADAQAAAGVVPGLRRRLGEEGLLTLHDEVECPLVRILARMEVAGVRVDTAELRRIADDLADQTGALVTEVHRLAGHDFNVNSTPQLRTVLYQELRLSPGRKTKTGYSTDAATLETLRDAHPIVDTLLRYRELEKLRSTYGENLLAEVAPDGRIHASFRQTVARTGRLSSERPNLHNIPTRTAAGQRFRQAFVPREEWRFLVADYDQVELRVIAHLSGDPGLVEAFTSGEDIHRRVASGVYGAPPAEVTRAQRDRAKMVSYGLAYGMEAFGLARRLSTGVDEANEIMERYFAAFPRVRAYMEGTVADARALGFTRTALGRKRPLPDLGSRNYRQRQAAERQAMNAGIQGLAADIFKTALVRLDRALVSGGLTSRLVLQVHDEVLVEAPPDEEAEVAALTEDALIHAVPLEVPLAVSMAWGTSWADAKAG